MRAVYIEKHGGPEVLMYGQRAEPGIGNNEVKVAVKASALNRLDTYVRSGIRGQKKTFPPPLTLGGDCSGEIVEIGNAVSNVKLGQRVLINPRISCGECMVCLSGNDDLCSKSIFLGSDVDGSYAELISVPSINVHPISDNICFEKAAALPTTYLPIWNMLMRKTQLKPWETVLVLSASAGVGTAAIQIAKNVIGARIIATTSTNEKGTKALALGADHIINYTSSDIYTEVNTITCGQGVDVVVDHVGAKFFESAFNSLKPGGRYGICGVTTGYKTQLHLGSLFTKQIQVFGVYMGCKKDMIETVDVLNQGKIDPAIHQIFPLDQALDAHKTMDAINFFGKLILRI